MTPEPVMGSTVNAPRADDSLNELHEDRSRGSVDDRMGRGSKACCENRSTRFPCRGTPCRRGGYAGSPAGCSCIPDRKSHRRRQKVFSSAPGAHPGSGPHPCGDISSERIPRRRRHNPPFPGLPGFSRWKGSRGEKTPLPFSSTIQQRPEGPRFRNGSPFTGSRPENALASPSRHGGSGRPFIPLLARRDMSGHATDHGCSVWPPIFEIGYKTAEVMDDLLFEVDDIPSSPKA